MQIWLKTASSIEFIRWDQCAPLLLVHAFSSSCIQCFNPWRIIWTALTQWHSTCLPPNSSRECKAFPYWNLFWVLILSHWMSELVLEEGMRRCFVHSFPLLLFLFVVSRFNQLSKHFSTVSHWSTIWRLCTIKSINRIGVRSVSMWRKGPQLALLSNRTFPWHESIWQHQAKANFQPINQACKFNHRSIHGKQSRHTVCSSCKCKESGAEHTVYSALCPLYFRYSPFSCRAFFPISLSSSSGVFPAHLCWIIPPFPLSLLFFLFHRSSSSDRFLTLTFDCGFSLALALALASTVAKSFLSHRFFSTISIPFDIIPCIRC